MLLNRGKSRKQEETTKYILLKVIQGYLAFLPCVYGLQVSPHSPLCIAYRLIKPAVGLCPPRGSDTQWEVLTIHTCLLVVLGSVCLWKLKGGILRAEEGWCCRTHMLAHRGRIQLQLKTETATQWVLAVWHWNSTIKPLECTPAMNRWALQLPLFCRATGHNFLLDPLGPALQSTMILCYLVEWP